MKDHNSGHINVIENLIVLQIGIESKHSSYVQSIFVNQPSSINQ